MHENCAVLLVTKHNIRPIFPSDVITLIKNLVGSQAYFREALTFRKSVFPPANGSRDLQIVSPVTQT